MRPPPRGRPCNGSARRRGCRWGRASPSEGRAGRVCAAGSQVLELRLDSGLEYDHVGAALFQPRFRVLDLQLAVVDLALQRRPGLQAFGTLAVLLGLGRGLLALALLGLSQ